MFSAKKVDRKYFLVLVLASLLLLLLLFLAVARTCGPNKPAASVRHRSAAKPLSQRDAIVSPQHSYVVLCQSNFALKAMMPKVIRSPEESLNDARRAFFDLCSALFKYFSPPRRAASRYGYRTSKRSTPAVTTARCAYIHPPAPC